jgi:hypothetical protein
MTTNVEQLPAVASSGETTLLSIIASVSADPGADVSKLERLIGLYERVKGEEARVAFTKALAQMQPELPEIEEHGGIRDKTGEVQSRYARWEDVTEAIKPVLAQHGFALSFSITQTEGKISVTGKLSHRMGHVEETTLQLPLDTTGNKNTVQAYGSSVSYGQRYTARALLNLTSRGDDDDGVAGGTAFISTGQREALDALIERGGADVVKFCAHLNIPSLDQLPARKFRFAERLLQQKIVRDGEAANVRSTTPGAT